MSTHAYTYRKLSSFSKEELNKKLEGILIEEFSSYVYSCSRDEYAKEMSETSQEELQSREYLSEDDIDYAERHSTFEACAAVWDKYDSMRRNVESLAEKYYNDADAPLSDFIKVIDAIDPLCSPIQEHNREYYIFVMFDTKFRCYISSEEIFDSYDKLISFLETLAPDFIVQYDKDENGNFIQISGLTDRLKEYLKDLYKDNDVFVYFI